MSETAKNTAPAAIASTTQTSRTRDSLYIELLEPRKEPDGDRFVPHAGDKDCDPYYSFASNV